MEVGNTLKKLRKQLDLSQEEFGEIVGVQKSHISLIENGKSFPSRKMMEKVSESFGVPVPIMELRSLDKFSVSRDKRELFELLKPVIDNLVDSLYPPNYNKDGN